MSVLSFILPSKTTLLHNGAQTGNAFQDIRATDRDLKYLYAVLKLMYYPFWNALGCEKWTSDRWIVHEANQYVQCLCNEKSIERQSTASGIRGALTRDRMHWYYREKAMMCMLQINPSEQPMGGEKCRGTFWAASLAGVRIYTYMFMCWSLNKQVRITWSRNKRKEDRS